MLKLFEHDARKQYPDLVVAALGTNRKHKPSGIVSARVLFDGSNGIAVNQPQNPDQGSGESASGR